MLRFDRFAPDAQEVAVAALGVRQRYDHNQVDTAHILLALLEQYDGVIPRILERLNVDTNLIGGRLDDMLRSNPKAAVIKGGKGQVFLTLRLKRVIDASSEEADRMSDEFIGVEHLFLAVLNERNTAVSKLLSDRGITRDAVIQTLTELRGGERLTRKFARVGKYRHLAQCSTPAGHFNVLAIDHRGNLLDSLNRHAPAPLSDAEFTAFKQEVIAHLSPLSSAVLADPEHGFGPGIAGGAIGGQVGLLSPLEITDYSLHPSRRATEFMPNWTVEKIKRVGASGVKLLLYYHPAADNAQGQRDIVARIVDECARYDIPFFLEPIAYSLDPDRALENAELRRATVESAATFSQIGVDVLKLEFPLDVKRETDESVWRAALDEVNAACSVPWALLSGGVDYDTFRRQVELASAAGASGVIVGRAVWGESVTLQGAARTHFLATTGRQRMEELGAICASSARSWREKVPPRDVEAGWYEGY